MHTKNGLTKLLSLRFNNNNNTRFFYEHGLFVVAAVLRANNWDQFAFSPFFNPPMEI